MDLHIFLQEYSSDFTFMPKFPKTEVSLYDEFFTHHLKLAEGWTHNQEITLFMESSI